MTGDPAPGPLAGKRIHLLSRYPSAGASSRLRLEQYVPFLRAAGAIVTISPFFDDAYLAAYYASGRKPLSSALRAYVRRLRDVALVRADLLWIEKEVFPYLPGLAERLPALRRIPYVVDYDDAVFHHYDQHARPLVRRLLATKLDPLLSAAAAVTAGNAYLATYATIHGAPHAPLIPTVIDPSRYNISDSSASHPLRIGWIGTPANTRYLGPVVEAVARLRDVGVVMVTIGAFPLPDLPVPQECHAWSEATEAQLLSTIDVGVMPLPDTPFERGKCGYKLIQYMAAGKPVIASPVGVNTTIVDPSVGLLATTADEWLDAFRRLATDAPLRHAMGRAARAKVERSYSIEVTAPVVIDLFAQILDAS